MGRSSGCHIRFMVKWVQDVIDEEGCVLRYGNDNYAFGSMRKRYQAVARKYEITLEVVWKRMNIEETCGIGQFRLEAFSFWALEQEFGVEGSRGVLVVPDWPGSEADSIMIQVRDMVGLLDRLLYNLYF